MPRRRPAAGIVLAAHVCNHVTLRGNDYSYETVKTDRQWLRDHAVKFNGWQHSAMGRGAKFDATNVKRTISSVGPKYVSK